MTEFQANKYRKLISAGGTDSLGKDAGGKEHRGTGAGCRAVGREAAWEGWGEQAEAGLCQGPRAGAVTPSLRQWGPRPHMEATI